MVKYEITCTDADGDTMDLELSADGTAEIKSNKFTTRIDAVQVKGAIDKLLGMGESMTIFNLSKVEIKRISE